MEVDADLANITIKTADVEHIKATLEDGYERYYEAEVEEEVLHISYDVKGRTFKQGPKIIIEIPAQMSLEAIDIDTDLGEVVLLELMQPIQELEIDADMGNIRVEDCNIQGKATMTAALGNIVIHNSHFKRVDASADMGNIEFSGSVEEEILAQADMGNIEVEVDGEEEDYNLQLSADMGTVEYEGQNQGKSFELYHSKATAYIILNCDMGNVELTFEGE